MGNNGTAAQPIFYTLPSQIGITSGFYAYDVYFKTPADFRYYNTKSPYSKLYLMLGEKVRSVVRVPYSQNITKNWNIGANFESIVSDKQYGAAFSPGDRNVIGLGYDIFTHFKTDSARYQILANFFRKKHRVREVGGIKQGKRKLEDFFRSNVTNRFKNAESRELRQQYHIYQQFVFVKPLQIYHELDWRNTWNNFEVKPLHPEDTVVMGKPLIKSDLTNDRTFMRSLWNEIGLKGDVGNFFYLAYYRNRHVKHQCLDKEKNNFEEHYIGLQTRYALKDAIAFVQLSGEYLLGGFYKMRGAYQDRVFDFSYQRLKYQPSLLVQHYQSNHRKWDNDFAPPTAHQVQAGINFGWPFLWLRPNMTFTSVKQPIYFNQRKQPAQAASYADMFIPGIEASFTFWRHIHADNRCFFANVQGPEAAIFKMPDVLLNTKIYYANTLFAHKLVMETGVDLYFQSSYHANNYDAATQQFFLQDQFLVYDYLVADLFFNFKIKNFKMFLKVAHINQGLVDPVYFVTPFYPGPKRAFDMGVSWSFFD